MAYREFTYGPPFKGIDVSLPECEISADSSPLASNWVLRGGELRTRPRANVILPGLPDGSQITGHCAFGDANNVFHTVVVSTTGLYQLNSNWRADKTKAWQLIGQFNDTIPQPYNYATFQVFLDQLYFTNGSHNLWNWNGMTPNQLSSTRQPVSIAEYDTTNHLLAGGYFLGELDSRLIILNTTEQVQSTPGPANPKFDSSFPQRIRWSASGQPLTWDPTVNIGAGYNDAIDVPDSITGFITIGRNGFIFRVNGITEMTSISSGVLPFDFNHLWASDRGIGNVLPFSICNYGPIGIFVASDDVYNLTLGGFKKIGGKARNAIFGDLANAIASPVASLFPSYGLGYPYLTYLMSIPMAGNTAKNWLYFIEDDAWMTWEEDEGFMTGRIRMVPTI